MTNGFPTQEDEFLSTPPDTMSLYSSRLKAVNKKVNVFVSPEDYAKIPKFEIKRRGKKNKW